jgi:integrase
MRIIQMTVRKRELPETAERLLPDYLAFPKNLNAAAIINRDTRNGFTYLVDARTMEPIDYVLKYLISCSSCAITTIKTKAEHIYEWILYLDAASISWSASTDDDIKTYRYRLENYISEKTGRPLEVSTIRGRLITIRDFNKWRDAEGLTNYAVRPSAPRVTSIDNRYTRQNGRLRDNLVPPAKEHVPENIPPKTLTKIFAQLGSDPLDEQDQRQSRDWLIGLFGVSTSARRFEIVALNWQQIKALELDQSSNEPIDLILRETKGGEQRAIAVPRELIKRLLAYIDGERKRIVAKAIENKIIKKDPTALFINGSDCPVKHRAKRYQVKRVDEAFAAAQVAAGVTRTIERINRDTGKIEKSIVPRHVFHHLRHSYVVQAWEAYKHLPEADRWRKIQLQCGHKSMATTKKTYARSLAAKEPNARDAYTAALKAVIHDRSG